MRGLVRKLVQVYYIWKNLSLLYFGYVFERRLSSDTSVDARHPALADLTHWVQQDPYHGWQLSRIFAQRSNTQFRVQFLLVVRWLPGLESRKYELCQQGLRDADVRVREAAARSLISLGGPEARRILRRHRDQTPRFLDRVEVPLSELPTAKLHRALVST